MKQIQIMIEIRNLFEKLVNITDHDWDTFSSKLVKRKFSKKSIILKTGQKEFYLSFIEKGIVRSSIPHEFNDLTFDFGFAGSFISAYHYFLTQQPSIYQIEAITDTILWSVSYSDLQDIYTTTSIGNTIGRLSSESLYIKKSKREISLLTQTAEERYLSLFNDEPHLLQLIPLKYIASYIGITPQALSRIRKRIS